MAYVRIAGRVGAEHDILDLPDLGEIFGDDPGDDPGASGGEGSTPVHTLFSPRNLLFAVGLFFGLKYLGVLK